MGGTTGSTYREVELSGGKRQDMLATIAPISALLLSVSIMLAGGGLQGTLLPIRANLEGFSSLDIDILGSAYYVGFGAGCLLTPHVVHRVKNIRAFTAMACIASSVALVHAIILTPRPGGPSGP